MLLQDIACVLCSPVIALELIPLLRIVIHDYLEMFTALYPSRLLTPKCHYLVNLPGLIQR